MLWAKEFHGASNACLHYFFFSFFLHRITLEILLRLDLFPLLIFHTKRAPCWILMSLEVMYFDVCNLHVVSLQVI